MRVNLFDDYESFRKSATLPAELLAKLRQRESESDSLEARWTCRVLRECIVQHLERLPYGFARVLVQRPKRREAMLAMLSLLPYDEQSNVRSLWTALFDGVDAALIDELVRAWEALSYDGPSVEVAIVQALTRAQRYDEAASRLRRVRWPCYRSELLITLAPRLSDALLARLIDEALEYLWREDRLTFHYRVGDLAALIAIDRRRDRDAQLRALEAQVRLLPEEELPACQDHGDLRAIMASCCTALGHIDRAVAWIALIPPTPGEAGNEEALALPQPHRDRVALASLESAMQGESESWWVSTLAETYAGISPTVALRCDALAKACENPVDRAIARALVARKLPSIASEAVREIDALFHDEATRDALMESDTRVIDALREIGSPAALSLSEKMALQATRSLDHQRLAEMLCYVDASELAAIERRVCEAIEEPSIDWPEREEYVAALIELRVRGGDEARIDSLLRKHAPRSIESWHEVNALPSSMRRAVLDDAIVLRRATALTKPYASVIVAAMRAEGADEAAIAAVSDVLARAKRRSRSRGRSGRSSSRRRRSDLCRRGLRARARTRRRA